MKYLIAVLALAFCASAEAGTFQVGIAEPGPGVISPTDVSALGLAAERRTVIWHGESTYDGTLTWTPGLRAFLTVSGGYPVPAGIPPTNAESRASYCGFVASILERYPQVGDVEVWNEPNLSGFWGVGVSNYASLLLSCAPTIRAHGARIWASMSPADPGSAASWAQALAPNSIDGWHQHSYGDYATNLLGQTIAAIRSSLGRKVPVLVGESGGTALGEAAWQMMKAYCAGAAGWLNFKLRNDGDWQATWLEDVTGTPLPVYWQVATEEQRIAAGGVDCSQPAPVVIPPHSWTPNEQLAERLGEIGGWARDAYLH